MTKGVINQFILEPGLRHNKYKYTLNTNMDKFLIGNLLLDFRPFPDFYIRKSTEY